MMNTDTIAQDKEDLKKIDEMQNEIDSKTLEIARHIYDASREFARLVHEFPSISVKIYSSYGKNITVEIGDKTFIDHDFE